MDRMTEMPKPEVLAVREECRRRNGAYCYCVYETVRPSAAMTGMPCDCAWVADFVAAYARRGRKRDNATNL
jgi:hypothetical protein